MGSRPPDADTFTVAALSAAIGDAVARAFPDQIWVRGEIRDLQRPSSGHVYFTLVDPDDDRARVPVTLFATEKYLVNRILTRSGAVRMTDGVDVRIRGEVTHYASRGTVQVRMTMIDPDYTVGRLAAERTRVLRALARDGLLERNRTLELPLVPLRIGLVTSRGSAAEADFMSTVDGSAYAFVVTAVDARVQGVDAVSTMIGALERLDGAVDLVALVRGGGSATDLAAFDDERLARRIAMMRTPVFTGVGHEIDRSVADEVAAASFKTPTEAAAAIVAAVSDFDGRLGLMRRRIGDASLRRAMREAAAIEARRDRLVRSGRHVVHRESARLDEVAGRVGRAALHRFSAALGTVDGLRRRLVRTTPLAIDRASRDLLSRRDRATAADPSRLLSRGWSITRGPGGEVLRSLETLRTGDTVTTRVAGGEFVSDVTVVHRMDQDVGERDTESPRE